MERLPMPCVAREKERAKQGHGFKQQGPPKLSGGPCVDSAADGRERGQRAIMARSTSTQLEQLWDISLRQSTKWISW